MSKNKTEARQLESRAEEYSVNRRRLLKAAAAAAPVVATLHSGTAAAVASASQCVIDSRTDSENGVPLESPPPSNTDKWVRRVATQQTFIGTGGFPPPTKTLWKIGDTWYDESGSSVTVPPPGFPNAGPQSTVYVLMIWTPDYTATGDPNAPNGVHPNGFWPVVKLGDDPANMAITGTCLCSVDAGFSGGTIFS